MYADKLGNNWAVVCQTCTRIFIFSTYMNKSGTRECPHCSDWIYHHDPANRALTVLSCNKEEQKPERISLNREDAEFIEREVIPVDLVDTETMFDGWAESRQLLEQPGNQMRYIYSDETYIDIDAGHSYRVIIGNQEEEFVSILKAEKYLWNNWVRNNYDAGEV